MPRQSIPYKRLATLPVKWAMWLAIPLISQVLSQVLAAEMVVDITANQTITIDQLPDSTRITLDGLTDEPVWQTLPAYDEFVVIDPDTLADVPFATRVKLFYTHKGFYVGINMTQPDGTLIKRLSGRDGRGVNRDSINLTLDTSGEGRYGFWFGVSLGNSLSDGTVLPERRFNNEWDGVWRGSSSTTDEGWSAEMFIPWTTLSMPYTEGSRRMGLYFSRKVAYKDERWGWPALPSTAAKFMSDLQPIELRDVNPKEQFSLFPFTSLARDRVEGQTRYKTGIDVFWRPSTNTQIAATINPDFGNVESDDLVINLTATETFFPEKRLFFLEGQDVFITSPRADTRGVGLSSSTIPYTMINTRRIGGKPRKPTLPAGTVIAERELIQPVDLFGAVKVTGQKGQVRYGALAALEEDLHLIANTTTTDVPGSGRLDQTGSDYGAMRLIYENNDSGYKALGILATAVLHEDGDAMAQGIDAHLQSSDGRIKIDGQFITSDIDGGDRGYGGFVDLDYTIRQGMTQRVGIEFFDEDIDVSDFGFLPRNDTFRIRTSHQRTVSDLSWARENRADVRLWVQRNHDGYFTGGGLLASNQITFHNHSQLTLRGSLFPETYDDLNSFNNGTFRVEQQRSLTAAYSSDSARALSYDAGIGYSQESLGGAHLTYDLGINWQPSDQFALHAKLSYHDRHDWLLHQRGQQFTTFDAEQWSSRLTLDYFLTARNHIRASLQWVGIRARESEFHRLLEDGQDLTRTPGHDGPAHDFALSQMSFQLRYRWEIAPLSDLFIVYTKVSDLASPLGEQSFSELFSDGWNRPINDTVVVKIRYRFGS